MPKMNRPENVTGAAHGKSTAAHGSRATGTEHAGKAAGQAKLHTVVNSQTGETKQVSQAEWRKMDKTVWTRPEETTGGETPASDTSSMAPASGGTPEE